MEVQLAWLITFEVIKLFIFDFKNLMLSFFINNILNCINFYKICLFTLEK